MTPFGKSVTWELRVASAAVGTASIIDYRFLPKACEALVTNALFYVCRTDAIEAARAAVFRDARALAAAIETLGVHPVGSSAEIDAARTQALASFEDLILAVENAQVTHVGYVLGVAELL
ncbi:hypothetical protein [Beijerinckia sp. L45]|uniref:hypothetical protein n=1 Tax=Beijerinckia sp. L45 TaxID=1641855 RepID=UPI00131D1B26|nr:hypothetical protein [Beijerinckia sp. L45]